MATNIIGQSLQSEQDTLDKKDATPKNEGVSMAAIEQLLDAKLADMASKKDLMEMRSQMAAMSADTLQIQSKMMTLSADTKKNFEGIRSEMATMTKNLQSDIGRLERHVDAIESAPLPYGRPKAFHSVTKSHSVSGSRLIRSGRF